MQSRAAGSSYSHVDHLDTPRLVANQSGQTVWRWDQQEPFGVNAPDENPSSLGVFEFPLRFAGQYFDKETNLHYNYFRDYDPSLGRYAESDPIGLRGGLNTYAYVASEPLVASDPMGLARHHGERLPDAKCDDIEESNCRRHCAAQGKLFEKCWVRRSWEIYGVSGEGKRRYRIKEEVICSCCDMEKSILQKFIDMLLSPPPKPGTDPFDDRRRGGGFGSPSGGPTPFPQPIFVP